MQPREIVLPITQPETEWIDGRPVQKMSPTFDHARVQAVLVVWLDAWVRGRGVIGTEWRFRIGAPGEPLRPLIPDVAFVSAARLRGLSREELQVPAFAPTVVVEILSPGDRPSDLASKTATYLAAGSELVVVIDPASRTLVFHDSLGRSTFAGDAIVSHPALPDLSLPLAAFFREALDLPFEPI